MYEEVRRQGFHSQQARSLQYTALGVGCTAVMAPTLVDPITRGWAVVTSAGVARLGLGFVASLVIARALGPADFGTFAVLAASVGIVGGLAEGGLTEAAVLRISGGWSDQPGAAQQRARAFFWLRLGLAATVVAAGCLVAGPLAQRILTTDDGLLRWALLGIVATAASGAVSAMLQATGAFGRMSSLTLFNTGLTALLAVGLALSSRLDLLAALVVLGIGTSLATFLLGIWMLPARWTLRLPRPAELRLEAAHLVRTGRWLWLASVFAMLTANAEVLLLNRWAALPLVGAYALALNLATKADLVNTSLYTVLLPGVTRLDDRGKVAGYLRRGIFRSGLIALGLLVLIPVSEPLIMLVYGADYATAVLFFQLLLGVMIFDVLLTPVLLLPLAYRQPKLLAAADGLRAVTLVLVAVGLIPIYGAFGAILARFGARLAGAAIVLGTLWVSRLGVRPHPSVSVEERPNSVKLSG
jgi:O-antigen/teichoic acid export membrane protein